MTSPARAPGSVQDRSAVSSSGPGGPAGAAAPGPGQLGRIDIADAVVVKIAAHAVSEIPDAGAAAPTILGLNLAGAAVPGLRTTDLTGRPKVTATVDGSLVVIDMSISVRWPRSVAAVTAAVRDHVRQQVARFTGLDVVEVRISVADFTTTVADPPRVR